MFRFTERRTSRHSTAEPPSFTTEWVAAGSTDGIFVRAYATSGTPAIVATTQGTLYRQDVRLQPVGFGQWHVTVPYGPAKRETGQYRLSFDTTGGTVLIRHSRATVGRFPETAPDHKQLIGVNGDQVEGAEIVIPALKLTVHFKHPLGMISLAQIKAWRQFTGAVSTDVFLTFAPGEVLFLGAVGSDGSDVESEVDYHFAISQNESGLQIGDIADVEKAGWDYTWISYKDAVDSDRPVKQPEFVYVERVYKEIAMASSLGFGA